MMARRRMVEPTITVPDPDAPMDSPIFEGHLAEVRGRLVPGDYAATVAFPDGTVWNGTLVVTSGPVRFDPAERASGGTA